MFWLALVCPPSDLWLQWHPWIIPINGNALWGRSNYFFCCHFSDDGSGEFPWALPPVNKNINHCLNSLFQSSRESGPNIFCRVHLPSEYHLFAGSSSALRLHLSASRMWRLPLSTITLLIWGYAYYRFSLFTPVFRWSVLHPHCYIHILGHARGWICNKQSIWFMMSIR